MVGAPGACGECVLQCDEWLVYVAGQRSDKRRIIECLL